MFKVPIFTEAVTSRVSRPKPNSLMWLWLACQAFACLPIHKVNLEIVMKKLIKKLTGAIALLFFIYTPQSVLAATAVCGGIYAVLLGR